MMLRRWAVREHFVSRAYLRMYLSDCLQILHTTPLAAFEIRPFRLSETTKICGGQSIVIMRLSARTIIFFEGYFYITLLFKGI